MKDYMFDTVDKVNLMQWSRGELEEFSRIWHKSIDHARANGTFDDLKKFFTQDCDFTWCVPGIKPSYLQKTTHVTGADEIVEEVKKNNLFGIQGWKRPWTHCFIDSYQGVILYIWDEISPYLKKDGTPFTTRCPGTTRIHYAGSYKIKQIEIINDPEYMVALKDELIAAGLAPQEMIQAQEEYYLNMAEDQKVWDAHLAELERTNPGLSYKPEAFAAPEKPSAPAVPESTPAPSKEPAPSMNSSSRRNDAKARTDHQTVRNHVGYYDFTHKLLEVTGLDARSFLSKMFVGSIAKAKVGQAKYTTMLNEDGIIIDDVIVFRIEEDTFWVSTLYIEELISWFDAHKTYEDVSYKEITDITTMYAVQGPASRAVLNEILENPVSAMKSFHIEENSIGDIPVKIARSGYTGELGYEIYCNPQNRAMIENKLETAGVKYGISKITTDVIVTSLPREKGFVLMSDLAGTNPLEAGFGWSIDWSKNFIGKKALEKINTGGISRELLGFVAENADVEIAAGTSVMVNGTKAGSVTVCTYGFTVEKNIGFALVDKAVAKAGDKAMILMGKEEIPVTLCERVFYDSKNDRSKETNIPSLEKAAMLPEALLRKNDIAARKDHEAIRNRVGYYDFTHKLLEVTGLDARSFLSKMFVGAVAKAKIGEGKYTTMLNENGTIIDDVIVFRMAEDTFWISTLYIDELIQWFDAHRTSQEVSYREITGITTMYAVQGPLSGKLLNNCLTNSIDHLKPFQICDNSMIDNTPVKVARSGYTGELGYEIYCNPKDSKTIETILEKYGQTYSITKIETDVIVTSLPREKGFVLMSDLSGINPLEAGFNWSIDWNKEFIGKAALQKIKEQGASRTLLGFTIDDDNAVIEPGSKIIVNGEPVGKVTVYTYGFTVQKNIGFALVNNYNAKKGDHAIIVNNGKEISATLCDRVFYDPKGERMKGVI